MNPALELGLFACEASAARPDHAATIRQLIPLAQRLAQIRPAGITVCDLRALAAKEGLLPPVGKARSLSYLGVVLRKAGLIATTEMRRSEIPETHGNWGRVYRYE